MDNLWPIHKDENATLFDSLLTFISSAAQLYFFAYCPDEDCCRVSQAMMERFGFPAEEFSGARHAWMQALFPGDVSELKEKTDQVRYNAFAELAADCRMIAVDGEKVWVTLHVKVLPYGAGGLSHVLVGTISEVHITSRVDKTTGLLTRAQFHEDFAQGLPEDENGVLLYLGIDDFKAVNGRYGHRFGNRLLRALAQALEEGVGKSGRAYRLEGDRFAVVLPEKNKAAASRFYKTVALQFQDACAQLHKNLFCTLSAGVAVYPLDSSDFSELCQFAESALNAAKSAGKDMLMFFSRDEYEQYLYHIGICEDLRHSVQNDFEGFELHFQPLLQVENGNVKGAEALLRWNSHLHGRISPTVFVPLLEQIGLICQVGRWVIDQALEHCHKWRRFLPDFRISINLSYIQFEKDDVAGYLLHGLQQNKLPGSAVLLEITESEQLVNYSQYNETLALLNQLGATVAIDDFGTGYSSLAYLKELHINQIKIDQCFVARIRESEYDFNLIRFIIEMAHSAGMTVCVEGVETAEDMAALLPLKPDYMQGFYFGRPADAEAFEKRFIHEWESGGFLGAQEAAGHVPVSRGEREMLGDHMLLLDEVEQVAFVGDMNTNEILFMNRAACEALGVADWTGMRCHEVFAGRAKPCEYCPKELFTKDAFYAWAGEHEENGRRFSARSRLMMWDGRFAWLCLAECSVRSDDAGRAQALQQAAAGAVEACVRELLAGGGPGGPLYTVLKTAGEFYQADRAFVYEFDEAGEGQRTCVWHRPGLDHQAMLDQPDPGLHAPEWRALLARGRPLALAHPGGEKADAGGGPRPTVLLAPFFSQGELDGFLLVDAPRYARGSTMLLSTLSFLAATEVAKRDLSNRLYRASYYDSLTGLYNRSRYVLDVTGRKCREDDSLGIVYADVDGLSALNESHNYEYGDELICVVARDLKECFEGHAVYRMGGDEFAVLCHNVSEAWLGGRVDALREGMAGRAYTLSIGSVWAHGRLDIEQLTKQAMSLMC